MVNWFDLMRQAQTSAGFEALTRQFQLSADQSQRAMAAVLPAFAMGLQHAAASNDPARFVQTMMNEGYQNFWQAAGRSFSAQAQQDGRRLLDQLFGSDEVSRRVAQQAASYAGVSADTMQQILPILAGILAGGMAQWMAAHAQAVQNLTSSRPAPEPAPAGNPWADLWAGWMRPPAPDARAPNPFEEMMAGFLQASSPAPSPPPQASQASASWDEMMQKGREMQMQYLTSLQSIFADAWTVDKKSS